jgi:hypothetical protein
MKMTTSWAFASSAVIAILVAGCTSETTDNSEGGVSTGAAGSSTGSAGSSAGSAGSGTGGSSGAGGSASEDSGTPPGPCEACAYKKCAMESDACEADNVANGCHAHVDDFYDCLGTADTDMKVVDCSTAFVSNVTPTGMSQSFAGDLVSCVTDSDPTKGCLAECMGGAANGDK